MDGARGRLRAVGAFQPVRVRVRFRIGLANPNPNPKPKPNPNPNPNPNLTPTLTLILTLTLNPNPNPNQVRFSPCASDVFVAGTTGNQLAVFDRRLPAPSGGGSGGGVAAQPGATLRNDSMVNSLHVLPDGVHVLSGDRRPATTLSLS